MWSNCTWYGYNCGQKQQPNPRIERPEKWTKEHSWKANDGIWHTLSWGTKWDDLEFYRREKKSKHAHEYEADALPDLEKYYKDVSVEGKVVVIV